MLKDHRPYYLKRWDIRLQEWYVRHYLQPQFAHMGKGGLFMRPWYVEVFGGPISLGDHAHVIATPDQRVRLTVWSTIEDNGSIRIGDYCLICPGVRISAGIEIVIENSCMMAQGAFITDSDWHDIYDRSRSVGQSAPVRIEDNAWIGDSAIVCKGVRIGRNSIVGAGAVVVKDVPDNVIVAGNPAVVVKEIDPERTMKTRAEWLSDPSRLAAEFEQIDRSRMSGNTLLGWLRALIRPRRGD